MIVLSNEAQATCNLSISGLSPNQLEILDAADMNSSTKTKTVTFNINNSGTSDCYYFMTIDEGVSGDINYDRIAKITYPLPSMFQPANTDSITYQLYSQSVTASNIVKTLNHAVFQQNVLGPRQIQAGQTLSESFLIHVPLQILPSIIAESYSDDVVLRLYEHPNSSIDFVNDCPTCTEVSNQPINIQFEITEYVTISLGNKYNPNSGYAMLDFGELESNEQQSFEVYVGGRTGGGNACTVSIHSENGSKLVHENVSGAPQSYDQVDYSVQAVGSLGAPNVSSSIDLSTPNTPVNLATSSSALLCGNNNMGVMGVDVNVIIGDVNKKRSGIYRDTITIDVTIGP